MIIRINFLLLLLATVSLNAFADDKVWNVSTGLSYRDNEFNLPSNKNDSEYWTTNVSLSRKINDRTYIGGTVLYSTGDVDYKTNPGNGDIDTTSIGAYVMRDLTHGLYVSGAASYGKSSIDASANGVNFDTHSNFFSASLGLTQYLPIQQDLMATLSARYTYISSNIDNFTTSAGTNVEPNDNHLNFITLGGRLDWRLAKLTPFVHLNWNKANHDFINGADDRDFFNYGLGANYALSPETSVGLTLDSVFDKRYVNETSAGINLSHRF